MSSILTNTSAMVALQTLKGINASLAKAQDEISTGKTIARAKDNAAVWAISKVMESDVKGFQAISSSLELGDSTVAVASKASETITDLLTDIKQKIVSAQEENVDREKIQAGIDALTGTIKSMVSAAQFSGLNLLQGTDRMEILSSLDRDSAGNVTASHISVNRQDLTVNMGQLGSGGSLLSLIAGDTTPISNAAITTDDGTPSGTAATQTLGADPDTKSYSFDFGGGLTVNFAVGELNATTAAQEIAAKINAANIDGVTATYDNGAGTVSFASTRNFTGASIGMSVDGGAATTVSLAQRARSLSFTNSAVEEGNGFMISLGSGVSATYVASKGDTMEDVVRGLKTAIDSEGNADVATSVTYDNTTGAWQLNIANQSTAASNSFSVNIVANDGKDGGWQVTGGLAGLQGIDVTTDEGARNALTNIESLIRTATEAAATFGAAAGQIESQADFISNLIDSMKAGIGALVDADMEEASARLQALQTQQQLGIQALSIANQQPQTILALFQ